MFEYLATYVSGFGKCLLDMRCSCAHGGALEAGAALRLSLDAFRKASDSGGKIIFIGNGGSAAIASHQAFDWWKNGKMRSVAFNDASLLTGGANDFGYEHAFAQALAMHGRPGDAVVAISSSGQSRNILNVAAKAREMGLFTLTLSAFKPDNPLRGLGDVNVYLDTMSYGYAELGHELVLHSILDYSLEHPVRR